MTLQRYLPSIKGGPFKVVSSQRNFTKRLVDTQRRRQVMMGLRGILLQQLLLGAIILAAIAASEPDASCIRTCGSLHIPYPFGTREGCYHDPSFLITCNDNGTSTPFLRSSNIQVLHISLNGELRVLSRKLTRDCYESGVSVYRNSVTFSLSDFAVSYSRNKFTAVGCDTNAVINGTTVEEGNFATGCISVCDKIDSVVNGSCSGIGCCQTSIPQGMKKFRMKLESYERHSAVGDFNPCSFAFIAEEEAYNFSSLDLASSENKGTTLPLVLDWAIGNETCPDAKKNLTSYACKAENSTCSNSTNGPGYRCNCLSGYQGNPYLFDGCQDINECAISNPCTKKCTNIPGSYKCDDCPEGYQGDGRTNGTGCSPILTRSRTTTIVIELVSFRWSFERSH